MSSSSLGTTLPEKGEGRQRVVKLRSIWHWELQLQGETGTGAPPRPGGATPMCGGVTTEKGLKVEISKNITSISISISISISVIIIDGSTGTCRGVKKVS